ncbi:OLC1v1031896C1 [Oldenlandia corymbosa var. corymbosa]|uniref:OLC1v1031896C1 n=1 Tax=Oldenlandia corymbosa var. corymbosa TaxID=529605 RepID=A0AAV1CMU7_OLDCO|nr:OLC1v1031896C1 [Oldenlandia corymbosa var. corymbosa]
MEGISESLLAFVDARLREQRHNNDPVPNYEKNSKLLTVQFFLYGELKKESYPHYEGGGTKFFCINEGIEEGDLHEVATDIKLQELCRDALAGDRLLVLYDYPVNDVVDDTTGEDAESKSDSDSSDGDYDEKDSEYDQEESKNDYDFAADDSGGVEGTEKHKASTSSTGAKKLSNSSVGAKKLSNSSVGAKKVQPTLLNKTYKPPERPKSTKRKKSVAERIIEVDGKQKLSKVGQTMSCSICKISGHSRRKCPSRTGSQGTQNEPAVMPTTGQGGSKYGSCGLTGHNHRKYPFIDPPERVVDLGSNADDCFDVVNLGVNIDVSSPGKRKLGDPDESNYEEAGLHESHVAKVKPEALRRSPRKTQAASLSQPIKIPKNVQMKKDMKKGKQKTKTDEKEQQDAEPDVMFLEDPVHQVKELRGRTISINSPNQAKEGNKAMKRKMKGNQQTKSSFQLIDEPIEDTQTELSQEPISKVTCKKEISAKVVSVELSSGTDSQINNSKFQETFGDVVPQQYKVCYSHQIAQLKNVKKVVVQSSMATKMHKPNGKIDWGSQAVIDNIAEQTAKAIARGNELYKMCGLKPLLPQQMVCSPLVLLRPNLYQI